MGNRPHFIVDTCNQAHHSRYRTPMGSHSCLNRSVYSLLLPQHPQLCVCGRCISHLAAGHKWQSGGWSQLCWPQGWCCPGPLSPPLGSASPRWQGNQHFHSQPRYQRETFHPWGISKYSYQTRGCYFTEQQPKRGNQEVLLVWVHPDLKDQRTV